MSVQSFDNITDKLFSLLLLNESQPVGDARMRQCVDIILRTVEAKRLVENEGAFDLLP